jgi:hypothetical protein
VPGQKGTVFCRRTLEKKTSEVEIGERALRKVATHLSSGAEASEFELS